ncbi:MAG: FAD-dependent oxidoreductase [Victivallales bacterium]|nr:FAD-dependent oxidoreductase [Victivallales bacterium]
MNNTPEIIIIGGGPAGLAAAIAAHDCGCKEILILEREKELGGILRQCIHPGFGLHRFKEELTGPEYAERFIREVVERKIPVQCDTMVLDIAPDKTVTCISSEHGLQIFKPKAVILAMGCRERPRGALGIPGTRCSGIYSAGTAQRLVNLEGYMPGRRIVILGSGDIGLIMARRMTFEGAKVLAAVELMPYSSGLKRNIVQCLDDYGIPLLLSHTVTQIHGRERLEGVTICEVDENRRPIKGTEQYLECDTLLLSVGLIPENELSKTAGVELDGATAGPVVDQRLETSVPGVFACGNVLHVHDLVDNVSDESEEAGRAAAEYVKGEGGQTLRATVKDGFGVRGVVPRRLVCDESATIRFMFRPSNVFRDATVEAVADGKVIASWKRRILTPGEMVSLTVKGDSVPMGAELEFRVVPKEEK